MVIKAEDRIFAPVTTTQEAVSILTSFTEDDLIKYERSCREQLITELETICLEMDLVFPLWLMHARAKSDIYDKQAVWRGLQQRTALEMLNDDFGHDFKNMGEFRKWLGTYQPANL